MKAQLKLENIYAWPTTAKTLFIAFLCLFIVITNFYLGIYPSLKEIHNTNQTNTTLQNKLNAALAAKSTASKHAENINNVLSHISINQLSAVGFLQQAKRIWGVLADPAGTVYHVAVGDIVGAEHGKITHISAKEIVIDNITLPITTKKSL